LATINDHFPFAEDKPEAATFIKLLTQWSATKNHFLEIDELNRVLTELEQDYKLPEMQSYVGCSGSDPKLRGYPCSLWQLFHTLTVQEYLASPEGQIQPNVLRVMKDYIINFFGCTDCAQNFMKETKGMDAELTHPNSSVLYLWRTHNKVNKRLAGDATEDAAHPKVQFPPKSWCSKCYFDNGTFDEAEVFKFLVDRHRPINLVQKENAASSLDDSEVKIANEDSVEVGPEYDHDNQHERLPSSFTSNGSKVTSYYSLLNRTDISLCLLLYFLSAGLIVGLFFIMKYRHRWGRKKYNKFNNSKMYP
jgi:thiol oxidase